MGGITISRGVHNGNPATQLQFASSSQQAKPRSQTQAFLSEEHQGTACIGATSAIGAIAFIVLRTTLGAKLGIFMLQSPHLKSPVTSNHALVPLLRALYRSHRQ